MIARHRELDALTGQLPTLAQLVARRAEQLATHHHADAWVIEVGGEWHTCHPGRARGSVSLGSQGFATRAEAVDEVLAETQAVARRVAALAERGDGRG